MSEVIDQSVLDELLSFSDDGDPELLVDLINMFLEDGPIKVKAVQDGVASGDLEMAERAAHSLKGSSGNLGCRQVQAICEELQISARNNELEKSRELAPQLPDLYRVADEALRQELAKHQ